VSFCGGETLIDEVETEAGVLVPHSLGKGLNFDRLRAEFARGVERKADHELGYGVLAQNASDGLQVGPQVGAMKGKERLRGVAERIRDGEPDAPVTDIEGQNPAWRRRNFSECQAGRWLVDLCRICHVDSL